MGKGSSGNVCEKKYEVPSIKYKKLISNSKVKLFSFMSENNNDTQWQLWEVFTQEKSGAPHEHAGSVRAPDKEIALLNARDVYSRRKEAVNIWVVLAENIVASTPEDVGSFFDPANDKIYRNPNFYKTPEGIKQI
jgi:ring-1,2-phenylacetyl-CoA epoxidase subunit PaaB